MITRSFFGLAILILGASTLNITYANDPKQAAAELETALELTPNVENGKQVYRACAVCHQPEGWGSISGYYPQIAGQIRTVIIKQLADIRARNRDNPTMLPFAKLDILTPQEIANVSAYIANLPMSRRNGHGSGSYLKHGKQIYDKNCAECHGDNAEGVAEDHMPLLQGQHYLYLVRQFKWIRDGRRRNADQKMVKQIQRFSNRDITAVMDYISRLQPPQEKLAPPDWRNPDFPRFRSH
ncbi:MAG: c-type cytochrome [Candidatus Thiodiazotropha sp. (ex Troendleina suluensis)]|nr:c-type cytochrome [Candidatus Thiodiazotropha sp. (ex Troendleina suluensis)]